VISCLCRFGPKIVSNKGWFPTATTRPSLVTDFATVLSALVTAIPRNCNGTNTDWVEIDVKQIDPIVRVPIGIDEHLFRNKIAHSASDAAVIVPSQQPSVLNAAPSNWPGGTFKTKLTADAGEDMATVSGMQVVLWVRTTVAPSPAKKLCCKEISSIYQPAAVVAERETPLSSTPTK
jgi:hypothetical protein